MSHGAVLSEKSSAKRASKSKAAPKVRDLSVCLLSAHPLVLGELEKLLTRPGFRIVTKQLESSLAPELRRAVLPKAGIYVIDAHASQQAAAALISNILEANPAARLIVVGEKLTEAGSYSLLRMGVKGLLTYAEAREQLPRTLPLVAEGGFWVPRVLLSTFVDSILEGAHGRQFKNAAAADLSRREQETLEALLENLSNKEIASKLNISERTVKFHVSNLLSKFGVRRRADLILLCYQTRSATA
jgi:DNA-binding NarL/FixJ family response regulator